MTTKIITLPKELKPEFRDKTTNNTFFVHHENKILFPNGKQIIFKDKLKPKSRNIKVKVHMIVKLKSNQEIYLGRLSTKGKTYVFESKRFKVV